ncbi:MAG: sorbosone dehydrogenase family protein, partial [Candidatus Hydrothermarchaeales archaeon]
WRWTLAVLALIVGGLLLWTVKTPFAPDFGTPGLLAPPNPLPQSTPQVFEPEGGLHSQQLQVPARLSDSRFDDRTLNLPPGFEASVYATGLTGARFMTYDTDGVLYVSQTKEGRISAVIDLDLDGAADEIIVFAQGLNQPHGLSFDGGWLYVAENDRVIRMRDSDSDYQADQTEPVISGLPSGGGHFTRTIGFGPDGKIYVSVGSSCNICEDDPRRAAVLRFNRDGSGEEVFATGLRNSVGFVWHPVTGEIYATDNGRDLLGDDLPPEEINILREGGNYGWPYCYGQNTADPKYNDPSKCTDTEPPAAELQAHSAPLGLRFYEGGMFPKRYQGALFVAYHGSWNRREPTGYKIVSINFDGETPVVEDFTTGWLADGEKWGRPVDIIFAGDGAMITSDDYSGTLYRVAYIGLAKIK